MPYCANCGTQIAETAKFCPSCGAAYRSSGQSSSQTAQQTPVSPLQTHQNTTAIPLQQNVVVMGKAKSVGVAFLLAFLFGPLGLLYATVIGGIVMFFVTLVLFFLLPIVGIVLCWIGCIICAIVAADQANKSMVNKGNALINNQFQR